MSPSNITGSSHAIHEHLHHQLRYKSMALDYHPVARPLLRLRWTISIYHPHQQNRHRLIRAGASQYLRTPPAHLFICMDTARAFIFTSINSRIATISLRDNVSHRAAPRKHTIYIDNYYYHTWALRVCFFSTTNTPSVIISFAFYTKHYI